MLGPNVLGQQYLLVGIVSIASAIFHPRKLSDINVYDFVKAMAAENLLINSAMSQKLKHFSHVQWYIGLEKKNSCKAWFLGGVGDKQHKG